MTKQEQKEFDLACKKSVERMCYHYGEFREPTEELKKYYWALMMAELLDKKIKKLQRNGRK